jgi:predicted PurR-regulated permease PerM
VEPRIIGDQIGLHPLATLVAMMVGLGLLGIIGMMLFPIGLVAITNMRRTKQDDQKSPAENTSETSEQKEN